METGTVVLAAGQGKRMKSGLPKVLHKIAGMPLICHVLDSLEEAGIDNIVIVVGKDAEMIQDVLGTRYKYALQDPPLGTGDAVKKALPFLDECEEILIVCGDTPLLTAQTLISMIQERRSKDAGACVLTTCLEDPGGYGRILRSAEDLIAGIIEDRDATDEQKKIKEVNAGTYVFRRNALESALLRLNSDNSQGEYYLTDCIELLRKAGFSVTALSAPPEEAIGVNTRRELAAAGEILRMRVCNRLMEEGVTIVDPATTYLDKRVEVGQDTIIYPFTFLEGKTKVGQNCVLGPGTRVVDSTIGDCVEARNSIIIESVVGSRCQIGPFAYIRPGSVLGEGVKIGDFVELKRAAVGAGSKIPHLSYVGDAVIGSGVNVGAGTITCNYDGVDKYETHIEDGAFIGSNTNLVAPVTVGKDAVTGAGSTITKDVPPGALALERSRQVIIPEWAKKRQKKDKQNRE